MIKLGSKYINPVNIAVVYEDTLSKSAIDDSSSGRTISKHFIPIVKLIMSNKETVMLEDITVDVVIRELGDCLPYAFVHIGNRFVSPKYINSVEDMVVNRTIVDTEDIKEGESVVVSGQQTFTVVDIYGVEFMRIDGSTAEQISHAIDLAAMPVK